MDEIARNAQTARLRAGFKTPASAAQAIGCSRPLVVAWEKGEAKIGEGKYLWPAALVYHVRPQWLAENEGTDGYPWNPGLPSEPEPPAISELSDDLPELVRALSHSHAFLVQALAATIPTAGRELLSALDTKLPADLREIEYIQVLRKTILRQLASDDMAALDARTRKEPAAQRRKRR